MTEKSPQLGRKLVRWVIAVQAIALVVLISTGVLLRVPMRHLRENMAGLTQVTIALGNLKTSLIDQETGQRGYDLTGNPALLEPFRHGTLQFNKDSTMLQAMVQQIPQVRPFVLRSVAFGTAWHENYGLPQVEEKQHGHPVSSASLLDGKRSMDTFRTQINTAIQWSTVHIQNDSRRLDRFSIISTWTNIVITFLTVVLVTWLLIEQFRTWAKPIRSVAEQVRQYSAGNLGTPVSVSGGEPLLQALFDDIELMRQRLSLHIGALQSLSLLDALTGIGNRRYFDEIIKSNLHDANNTGHAFCVLLCDIDHFKALNDTKGHREGDRVLMNVAQNIAAIVTGIGTVTRYGGEEFTVLLPYTLMQARPVAETIRHQIQARCEVTISIGIAEIRAGDTEDSLLGRADEALYRAKNRGRNRIELIG